ncbi:hypothetical protein TNCV_4266441 [Trichonephila clavipes]|nr:hypothetical protein TNCV_4266441 [Trichonephila clavipes]
MSNTTAVHLTQRNRKPPPYSLKSHTVNISTGTSLHHPRPSISLCIEGSNISNSVLIPNVQQRSSHLSLLRSPGRTVPAVQISSESKRYWRKDKRECHVYVNWEERGIVLFGVLTFFKGEAALF